MYTVCVWRTHVSECVCGVCLCFSVHVCDHAGEEWTRERETEGEEEESWPLPSPVNKLIKELLAHLLGLRAQWWLKARSRSLFSILSNLHTTGRSCLIKAKIYPKITVSHPISSLLTVFVLWLISVGGAIEGRIAVDCVRPDAVWCKWWKTFLASHLLPLDQASSSIMRRMTAWRVVDPQGEGLSWHICDKAKEGTNKNQ